MDPHALLDKSQWPRPPPVGSPKGGSGGRHFWRNFLTRAGAKPWQAFFGIFHSDLENRYQDLLLFPHTPTAEQKPHSTADLPLARQRSSLTDCNRGKSRIPQA